MGGCLCRGARPTYMSWIETRCVCVLLVGVYYFLSRKCGFQEFPVWNKFRPRRSMQGHHSIPPLPPELVQLIFAEGTPPDHIVWRSVCKTWRYIVPTVRAGVKLSVYAAAHGFVNLLQWG